MFILVKKSITLIIVARSNWPSKSRVKTMLLC